MNSLNNEHRIPELLADLAREDRELAAPARVEEAVLRSVGAARARPRRLWLAAAAALILGVLLSTLAPDPGIQTAHAPEPPRPEIGTSYFPLRAGPLLNQDELGQVVRVSVSKRELYLHGIDPIETEWNGGTATVRADVLVGMDGTARAIRFVH
jgi:hypothetical protein